MIFKTIILFLLSFIIYWMAPKVKISPQIISLNENVLIPPNDVIRLNLKNAVRKFENKLFKPESFTHDPKTGDIYTGTADGFIWKINRELTHAEQIIRIGNEHIDCGLESAEHRCGRVLGLKFLNTDKLIALCTYQGIFVVNLKEKSKELLVGPEADVKLKGFFNSVYISKGRILYFTISSMKWTLANFFYSFMENDNTGAVYSYDMHTKELNEIVKDIYFANGLILSEDQNYIIVSEMLKRRLLKIDLREVNRKATVFLDSLPGIPDNIQKDNFGNFYVSIVEIYGLAYFQNHPSISSAVAWWIPKWIQIKFINFYGYVYKINEQGKIITVIDDPQRGQGFFTEAYEVDNKILLGNIYAPYLEVIYLK